MSKIFPLIDFLYIYQLYEYDSRDFLTWFLKNPLKRNLQRKHTIVFTQKIISLFILTILLLLLASFLIAFIFSSVFLGLISFLFFVQISPFFIVLSFYLLLPVEIYKKQQIIRNATKKLKILSNLKIISISGSYAKTSIKDMLYTLLWKDFYVVKTPKSYNTQLSIGRTIVSMLKKNTDIFLVEMDAYHKNELAKLSTFVNPMYSVITAIAPQHLGRFGSMEKLAAAQFEVAQNLPSGGLLFINSTDEWSMKLESNYTCKKIFFGLRSEDDYRASDIKQTKEGLTFTFYTPKENVKINLPLFGKHHVINFLAAAALANTLGIPLKTIQKRAGKILPTAHRQEIKKLGNLTLIDNSYNTNPKASKASLDTLREFPGKEKILLTPGLVELGSSASEENIHFAKGAARVCDYIIIVGQNAKNDLLIGLKEANFPKEQIVLVKSTKDGLKKAQEIAKEGSVLLLENDLPDQYF